MIRWIAALAALFLATAAGAEELRPYIFTQAHAGSAQVIARGIPVEIQLPAGPARWAVDAAAGATLTDERSYASPGRIDGTDRIQVFDFSIDPEREATIIIVSGNPPPVLSGIVRDGRFVLILTPVAP